MEAHPQDLGAGHAGFVLASRLLGLLVDKKVLSRREAQAICQECAAVQQQGGGPANLAAAQMLYQMALGYVAKGPKQ